MLSNEDLAALLPRVALRDRAAFEQVYRASCTHLLSVAFRILNSRERAEEVLQEAFMNVWHGAGGFDASVAGPMTWLINIVRNKAIDALRSGKTERASTLALDEEAMAVAADDAGRVLAHPSALASRLYPGDAEARLLLTDWLTELEDQHCIERYTVDEMDYLRIVNWRKHQKIYHPTPSRLPARPVVSRQDSGAIRESLGSESEKPNDDKALTSSREISRATREPREELGKNLQNPDALGLSRDFPSDSRGEGFFRRVAGAAQRALGR